MLLFVCISDLDVGLPQKDMGTSRPKTAVISMQQKPEIQRTDSPVGERDKEVPAVYKGVNPKSDTKKQTNHGSSRRTGERPSSSAHRSRGMAGPITSSLDVSQVVHVVYFLVFCWKTEIGCEWTKSFVIRRSSNILHTCPLSYFWMDVPVPLLEGYAIF